MEVGVSHELWKEHRHLAKEPTKMKELSTLTAESTDFCYLISVAGRSL